MLEMSSKEADSALEIMSPVFPMIPCVPVDTAAPEAPEEDGYSISCFAPLPLAWKRIALSLAEEVAVWSTVQHNTADNL
jgi:hypothetical protein